MEYHIGSRLGTTGTQFRPYDEDSDGLGPWLDSMEAAQRIIDVAQEYSRSVAYAVAVGNCPWCIGPASDARPLVSLDLVPAPSGMHAECAELYVEAGATFPPER